MQPASNEDRNPARSGFNPWPVAIGALCATAFVFAGFIAFSMIRQKVDLVAGDYYERDLQHNARMMRERRALALQQKPVMHVMPDRNISIVFPDKVVTGTIKLYRPSDSSGDVIVALQPDASGTQIIPAETLAPGLWHVQIVWARAGEDYEISERIVLP